MTVADDAIPVTFDHCSEFLKRFQAAPSELRFPVLKELPRPSRVIVRPELTERLFEKIGFVNAAISIEQELQGPPAIQVQVLSVGKQRITLALDEPSFFVIDTFVLAPSDLVHCLREMVQHMELIEDELGGRCMVPGGVSERLPHIHDRELDAFRSFRSDFIEEEVHVLFPAAFASKPDRALLIQIGDDDYIGMALGDGYLIDADDPKIIGRWMLGQERTHIVFFDAPDLIPAQAIHLSYASNGHLPALATDGLLEPLGKALG